MRGSANPVFDLVGRGTMGSPHGPNEFAVFLPNLSPMKLIAAWPKHGLFSKRHIPRRSNAVPVGVGEVEVLEFQLV